ncbi:DUF3857 domain-containing protein [Neolewinella aurantiaca]|uniref:DUF3857 domain-containing protein n=1 Tax=Neolewinella aurantiaca TaxID=2602767 RepID=A0A5C7FN94_9BACT|nr:DUF3857 domain-containing protein [Neolewinella aurantiaca]TXF87823.1 DUF3857 domain-containing protein [Neolewinella aurantiaca]
MRSFILLVFLSFNLGAQDVDYSAFTIPPELKEGASSVVRLRDITYEVHSTNKATRTERKVVTILNDQHQHENRMVMHYDKDTDVVTFKATLYDAYGDKVKTAKKSDIEDFLYISSGQFYEDNRVMTTVIEDLSYPYTVEFEYKSVVKDFSMVAGFPNWQPLGFNQSVERASFEAIVPADNELLYYQNELPEPETSSSAKGKVYRWEVSGLTARKYETDAPPASKTMPYLRTGLRAFSIGDYHGTYDSWQSFGAFIGGLMDGRDELPGELVTLVHESTNGISSEREKIEQLYRLLQERTRYVGVQLGVGGWQPFSAGYVEENRFGDCKALSNYMGAMLKEVGIESYPVLVYAGETPYFPVDENFTTSAFNHMILYVPSEDMYLECTSSDAPPGYLGDGTDDRNVLHITPEGGKLARTPALKTADNGHLRTITIAVKNSGSADVRLDAGYYGASHDLLRYYASNELDEKKLREGLQRNDVLPDVNGQDFSLSCNPDLPVAELRYTTEVPGYVRKLGKRMFVPLNKFYAYDYVPDKLTERKFPIVSNIARFYVDTVHLNFPDELEVESLGDEETTIRHAAGEYRAQVVSAPGSITWIRTLKLLPVDLPASGYEEYRQFFVDVRKAEKRQVVLRTKRTK